MSATTPRLLWQGTVGTAHGDYRVVHWDGYDLFVEVLGTDTMGQLAWRKVDDDRLRLDVLQAAIRDLVSRAEPEDVRAHRLQKELRDSEALQFCNAALPGETWRALAERLLRERGGVQ